MSSVSLSVFCHSSHHNEAFFFIFVPWIYALPFLWVWPILESTWLLRIDQSFLCCLVWTHLFLGFFFHTWVFLVGVILWPYAFVSVLLGRYDGARWLLQFLLIHSVPKQLVFCRCSKLICLVLELWDTLTDLHKIGLDCRVVKVTLSNQCRFPDFKQTDKTNNVLTSGSHPEVIQPAVRFDTSESYWLHTSCAWKYPLWHHQNKPSTI